MGEYTIHGVLQMPVSVLAQGKTKTIEGNLSLSTIVKVTSSDDITAGDGARRDRFDGKARLANLTTCHFFELLKRAGIPLAYQRMIEPHSFAAEYCDMQPYEVVARRVATGSYCKRNPEVKERTVFDTLVVEFFLKTTGPIFKGIAVPKDDPLIVTHGPHGVDVVHPTKLWTADDKFVRIPAALLYGTDPEARHPFKEMEALARKTFLVLEAAWREQNCTYMDFKIEFGRTKRGQLVVADVIDNDSGRLLDEGGNHLDKQRYRDGADLATVKKLYEDVQKRASRFEQLPRGQIVLWRGSESDLFDPFDHELERLSVTEHIHYQTLSAHKKPEAALDALRAIGEKNRPTVVIAYVGLSNGLGPILQAATHAPVIAVPASFKAFPDDVWSSLRMPSDVPLVTVLSPGNAILAALGILAQVSPGAYMVRRYVTESHHLTASNSPALYKV